ncbi:MAG: Omp28-related outer membrane protein [Ferruginibacter sp.]
MRKYFSFPVLFIGILVFSSCTKTESDFSTPASESISLKSSIVNVAEGSTVTFTINSSINNADVTNQSQLYVNGTSVTGNSYTFSQQGSYAVYATRGTLTSNILTIQVTHVSAGFINHVLVEEYSGTWCGNCPAILYGVDLVHQQTDRSVIVGIHLLNDDPYITTDGNTLASNLGVTGVPTGYINRTISWAGPQYENVSQVINEIQASSNAGLAISSAINGNTITASIKVGYIQPLSGNAKLTVYLVEDSLYYTQRNYSATLYNGQPYIPGFEYNGVLRAIVSSLSGDDIANSGSLNEKNYSISIPANIANIANIRLVAFVSNDVGSVVNVQDAKVGEIKDFENL